MDSVSADADDHDEAEGTSDVNRYASFALTGTYDPAQFVAAYELQDRAKLHAPGEKDDDDQHTFYLGGNHDFGLAKGTTKVGTFDFMYYGLDAKYEYPLSPRTSVYMGVGYAESKASISKGNFDDAKARGSLLSALLLAYQKGPTARNERRAFCCAPLLISALWPIRR